MALYFWDKVSDVVTPCGPTYTPAQFMREKHFATDDDIVFENCAPNVLGSYYHLSTLKDLFGVTADDRDDALAAIEAAREAQNEAEAEAARQQIETNDEINAKLDYITMVID